MQGLRIRWLTSERALVVDLRHILDLIGDRAVAAEWRVAGVSALGERCMELEALGDPPTIVSGARLGELARAVTQIIDGELIGYEPGMSEPWIIVRAFDSSYWELWCSDAEIVQRARDVFRDVTELGHDE